MGLFRKPRVAPEVSLALLLLGKNPPSNPTSKWEQQALKVRAVLELQESLRRCADLERRAELFSVETVRIFHVVSCGLSVVVHKTMNLVPAFPSRGISSVLAERTHLSEDQVRLVVFSRDRSPRVHDCEDGMKLWVQALLTEDGDTMGVIELKARSFTPDDALLLELLVPPLESAIHSRRQLLLEKKRRVSLSDAPLQQLLQLVGGVAEQLEVQPLIRHIRLAAMELMGAEMCTVFLVDAAQEVKLRAGPIESRVASHRGR